MTKLFAIIYETGTQNIRRLIDTADDPDDSHLAIVKPLIAHDETMEGFPVDDHPHRWPRFMIEHIGRGVVL